ncbi:DUF4407 domain-containing protein [Hufsiella ginkgonis]|uniref:DUF4407 domain-containing protein n=1 Tax=Hufsiella ginkgonis TaxID=2695274 RepID=A0A7K1XUZ2_9SPHI|nr:DUF4407 domain-containing protein [Hufsiella ginkgonis]MXV14804.1 DUF4407 domain-containing protein [Hufsiella ginkgonis]
MNLFYFLSKTDQGIVRHCTAITKNIQATLGFFVLLTGTMALVSGTYAISNMFIREDAGTGQPAMMPMGWFYSAILGTVYCIFIVAIDREIVSASNKIAALLRLPLAIIISLIVSTPIEMQLFDARLVARLQEEDRQVNKPLADRLTGNTERIITLLDSTENKRLQAMRNRDRWIAIRQAELTGEAGALQTGRAGDGPAYKLADQNVKSEEINIAICDRDLTRLRLALKEAEIKEDTVYLNKKATQSYDFLSKSVALGKVKKEDSTGSAGRTSWGITVLFFLFETIPCIVKLLLPKTEYDVLIEKRRQLNILSAVAIYEEATSEYNIKSAEELQSENPRRIQQMLLSQSD